MLAAQFTEAVDALLQNPSLSDDALHNRAHQYLNILANSNPAQLSGPRWAERIQKVIPHIPSFATLHLFRALYYTADELDLVAGKRYVSATICACADRVTPPAPEAVGSEGQSTDWQLQLVRALDDVASIWAAFVLWPIYAHGTDNNLNPPHEPRWTVWADSPPELTGESQADCECTLRQRDSIQHRRWKLQVMARDNYTCFMCGYLDTVWFFKQNPEPEGEDLDFDDCDIVPIIKREAVLTQKTSPLDELPDMNSNVTWDILKRYFGADETLFEKAEGPKNLLFVNMSACERFRRFRWCLHPTETPNRYKIVRIGLRNDRGSRHVTSHVTFADHSQSHSRAGDCISVPVDLPDCALLRLHAALAGVLWRSGAIAAFDRLFFRPLRLPGHARWPAPTGEAFWTSVVEYEGEEMCLEVDIDLSMGALRDSMREHALAGSA